MAVTAKEGNIYSLGLLMRDLAELDGDTDALPSGWNDVAERAKAPHEANLSELQLKYSEIVSEAAATALLRGTRAMSRASDVAYETIGQNILTGALQPGRVIWRCSAAFPARPT